MLGTEHCYSEDDYARISLRSWVSVVYGKMTKIDRFVACCYIVGEQVALNLNYLKLKY